MNALDAYAIWTIRARPSPDEKAFVVNRLPEREAHGPPAEAIADDKLSYTVRAGQRDSGVVLGNPGRPVPRGGVCDGAVRCRGARHRCGRPHSRGHRA